MNYKRIADKRHNDAGDCRTRYSGSSPKPGRRNAARKICKAAQRKCDRQALREGCE